MLTDEQLTAWEFLASNATPGPWDSGRGDARSNVVKGPDGLEIAVRKPGAFYRDYKDDAEFIASSREGWPATLEEVRRLRAEREAARLSALLALGLLRAGNVTGAAMRLRVLAGEG